MRLPTPGARELEITSVQGILAVDIPRRRGYLVADAGKRSLDSRVYLDLSPVSVLCKLARSFLSFPRCIVDRAGNYYYGSDYPTDLHIVHRRW